MTSPLQEIPGSKPVRNINLRWAALALALLAALYTLAWVGRPLVNYLQAYDLMKPAVAVISLVGLFFLLAASRWMGELDPRKLLLAALVFILSMGLSLIVTRTLAEAIHTVEYELLAICIYNSLRPKLSGRNLYSYTLFLVLAAGWSDELMQSFAPDRYYDLADVLLNMTSGGFGIIIAAILTGAHERQKP